jgi:hypothetical protein
MVAALSQEIWELISRAGAVAVDREIWPTKDQLGQAHWSSSRLANREVHGLWRDGHQALQNVSCNLFRLVGSMIRVGLVDEDYGSIGEAQRGLLRKRRWVVFMNLCVSHPTSVLYRLSIYIYRYLCS